MGFEIFGGHKGLNPKANKSSICSCALTSLQKSVDWFTLILWIKPLKRHGDGLSFSSFSCTFKIVSGSWIIPLRRICLNCMAVLFLHCVFIILLLLMLVLHFLYIYSLCSRAVTFPLWRLYLCKTCCLTKMPLLIYLKATRIHMNVRAHSSPWLP